jgi:hypothetical protein
MIVVGTVVLYQKALSDKLEEISAPVLFSFEDDWIFQSDFKSVFVCPNVGNNVVIHDIPMKRAFINGDFEIILHGF